MKLNETAVKLTAFTVLIILCLYFYDKWQTAKKTNDRLNRNMVALAIEFKQFKKQAVTVPVLEMTKKEIKDAFPGLEERIKKEFNQKLKNVETYTKTDLIINRTFETTLKDSIINDTVKVKSFKYTDKWTDFQAYQKDTIVKVIKNSMPVPLEQLVYREKWKLFHPFRARPLEQQIRTENPYAVIEFNRVIKINRK